MCSFSVYASSRCHPKDSPVYLCDLAEGAIMAIVAIASYFLAAFLTCIIPKAQPLLRRIQEMERGEVTDDCDCCEDVDCTYLCFCNRSCRGNPKVQDDEQQEQPKGDAVGANNIEETQYLISPTVTKDDAEDHHFTTPENKLHCAHDIEVHGVYYKQYHDEKAGATLQNQYTAAYHRWLGCEQDYLQILDRFKAECKELNVSWRSLLLESSIASTTNGPPHRRRKSNRLHEENDGMIDEELLRLVSVLQTLNVQCQQAKQDMERIRYDLIAHTVPRAPTQLPLESKVPERSVSFFDESEPKNIEKVPDGEGNFKDDDGNDGSNVVVVAAGTFSAAKSKNNKCSNVQYGEEYDETEIVFDGTNPTPTTSSDKTTNTNNEDKSLSLFESARQVGEGEVTYSNQSSYIDDSSSLFASARQVLGAEEEDDISSKHSTSSSLFASATSRITDSLYRR